jgi:hypothetical protein
LTIEPLWKIPLNLIPQDLHTADDIYYYTKKTLTYNYGRITKNLTRLGAGQALTYPDQAVCSEFSDVFVGLARKKEYMPVKFKDMVFQMIRICALS